MPTIKEYINFYLYKVHQQTNIITVVNWGTWWITIEKEHNTEHLRSICGFLVLDQSDGSMDVLKL